jgi:hypothetical protein
MNNMINPINYNYMPQFNPFVLNPNLLLHPGILNMIAMNQQMYGNINKFNSPQNINNNINQFSGSTPQSNNNE